MERIDISTNSSSITQAYEKVVRGDGGATYSVFSVDKNGTLEVSNVSTGPLEDFVEEFSDGTVQFGLAKVTVPGSDVSKNLLLGWCPDNAPAKSRLSYAANFADVSKVLSGYHVQITARDHDDLDVEEFVSRVAAAAGARYTAHSAPSSGAGKSATSKAAGHSISGSKISPRPVNPKPVAKPTFASPSKPSSKELSKSTVDEDDGWAGEQELEERDLEKQPLEDVPSAYKPTKVNIAELRKQKSDTVSSKKPELSPEIVGSSEKPSDGRLTSLPKPKVGSSVASRYTAATKNASGATFGAKPLNNSKPNDKVVGGLSRDFGSSGGKTPAQLWAEKKGMYKDVKAEEDDLPKTENENYGSDDAGAEGAEEVDEDDEDQGFENDTKQSNEHGFTSLKDDDDKVQIESKIEKLAISDEAKPQDGPVATPNKLQTLSSTAATKNTNSAKAEYDYEKDEDNELEFKEDDIIVDIEFVDEEWWSGKNKRTGELGLFPASYVTLSEDSAGEEADAVLEGQTAAADESKTAVAEFAYEKDEDNEIAFDEGDLIVDIEFVDDSWWSGKNSSTGEIGLFPSNYVKLN